MLEEHRDSSILGSIESITGRLPAHIRQSITSSQERVAQRVQSIPQPTEVVDQTTLDTLRDTIVRETLMAFSGTLTRTLKAYIRTYIRSLQVPREVTKIMIVEFFSGLVDAVDAGIDDLDAGVDNWTEAQTRQYISDFFTGGQAMIEQRVNQFLRRFTVAQTLPDLDIPAHVQRMIDANELTVPDDLACGIMHTLMVNPVTLVTVDGVRTYDRQSLLDWQRANGEIECDPITRSPVDLSTDQMLPSLNTRERIRSFILDQPLPDDLDVDSDEEFIAAESHPGLDHRHRPMLEIDTELLSSINQEYINDSTSHSSCYFDPFTKKLMLRPVDLKGLTIDLSSICSEILQPKQCDSGEMSIVLPCSVDDISETRTYTFASWDTMLRIVHDDLAMRNNVSKFIARLSEERSIAYDPAVVRVPLAERMRQVNPDVPGRVASATTALGVLRQDAAQKLEAQASMSMLERLQSVGGGVVSQSNNTGDGNNESQVILSEQNIGGGVVSQSLFPQAANDQLQDLNSDANAESKSDDGSKKLV